MNDQELHEAIQYNRSRNFAPSMWRKIQVSVAAVPDGVPGQETAESVAAFQKIRKLTVDGKVGPTTLSALGIPLKEPKVTKYRIESLVQRFPELDFGIDVSNYQGVIDWLPVSRAGVKFVIVKATEGRTHVQHSLIRNLQGARNYGIPCSAYHLARLTDRSVTKVMDPIGGAENFYDALRGQKVSLPLFLDLEHKQVQQMVTFKGAPEAVKWILKWLERFEELCPQAVGLYLSHRTASLIGAPSELTCRPTWWAYYKSATWGGPPKTGRGWETWSLRQFTSAGRVPGIDGKVDMNYSHGTASDLFDETLLVKGSK